MSFVNDLITGRSKAHRLWIQLIPLTVITVLAYWPAIENLLLRWSEEQEYSHGYLIPFVSVWMVWSRRKALESVDLKPSWIGFPILIGSAVLALIGFRTGVLSFAQVALITTFFGLTMLVGGWNLTRLLSVPIAFLFFMVPLPYFLTAKLSGGMQLLSSELGVAFVRLFDVPVFLDGNVIDLGIYKLGVVDACSGLRYLFPFLSLGFLAAYTADLSIWKRIAVFLSVIPITIVMNSVRIGFIGVLVHFFGIEQAEGFMHYFEGWVVFVICIAMLIAVVYCISWFSGKRQIDLFRFPEFSISGGEPVNNDWSRGVIFRSVVAGMVLVVVGASATIDQGIAMTPPSSKPLFGLPYDIEGWTANRILDLDPEVEAVLAADDYVGADMSNPAGDGVNLFVAYIERKRGRATWHSPQQCIPGGGWKIKSIDHIQLIDAHTGDPFFANRVLIERNQVRQLVYYWFQQRGRRFASEWTVRYYVILDSLLKGRTDGALVRLVTPLEKGADIEAAEAKLKAFASELSIPLPQYVPE